MGDQSQLPGVPARSVLEGVPWVGFYQGGERCPEDVPFPSCLRACLEFMGENLGCKHLQGQPSWGLGCAYAYLMGVSGCAFRLSWKPGWWHGDNAEIRYMSDDPAAPFDRAFEAVGYAYESVGKGAGYDEADFRSRIIESICDHGQPVLAFGVIGPPECCIITGYDEGGDVLVGWNFFQGFPESSAGVEFEPSGYFRKRDWFRDTEALIVIGEKQERPAQEDIYRKALEWALQVARTPVTSGDRRNGLMAYAVWADHLLRDEDFPADDMDVLRGRFEVHDDAVGTVAEARWYGSLFLAHIAQEGGDWQMSEDLYRAAACYAAEHALMWGIWDLVGGIGHSDDRVAKLAEPGVRRQIVGLILKARDKDAQAADHIERALARSTPE
jgi:hypothetical protein